MDTVALWTLGAGCLVGAVAAVAGGLDFIRIRLDHPGRRIGKRHGLLGTATLALFLVNYAWRVADPAIQSSSWVPEALSATGLVLLTLTGFLGGKLVYDYGVGVGRHRQTGPVPAITRMVPQLSPAMEWVALGAEELFKEKHLLRFAVGDVVFTAVRCDGQIVAVQEFCTHRFGPLSEGAVRGCEVECPWHRSRFNLKTGEVREGPAKVGLRTFPLEVRAGQVFVKITQGKPAASSAAEAA